MTVIKHQINVRFEHQVYFTDNVFDVANPLLQNVLAGTSKGAKALAVVDESLATARPALLQDIAAYFAVDPAKAQLVGPPIVIEGGERAKNSYFHVSEIHSQIERAHLDRQSYLLAVGGGALLDVAGLAAATAHRGLRLVRIPTTTLSQCDAGVGVKNGINAFGKKNFIGTFAPPWAVINDFQMLSSLSARDKRGGYSEAVKVALIRDRELFEQLERAATALAAFELDPMRELVQRSAAVHARHIAEGGDPFEFGSARPLDFGHWAAHKLEQLSENRIRHGEAVAMGIALDVIYSRRAGLLAAAAAERALALLEALGFELFTNEMLHLDTNHQRVLLKGLEEFREHLGGELTLTLLRDIGQGVEVHEICLPKMMDALEELQQRHDLAQARIVPARRA